MIDTDSRHVLKLAQRKPLAPELQRLQAQNVPFEMSTGANCRIWVKAGSAKATSVIVRVLQECATRYDEDDVEAVVQRHAAALHEPASKAT